MLSFSERFRVLSFGDVFSELGAPRESQGIIRIKCGKAFGLRVETFEYMSWLRC